MFISVLIPTYNRKELLKETLESVFNQTFKGLYEVIVVDDGSTDGTWEYLKNLSLHKKNLVIARHEKNKGVSETRNTLLNLSKGEYILFLDSDDLLVENALEKVYNLATKKKEVNVFLLSVFFLKNGKIKSKPKIFDEPSADPIERLKQFIDGRFSDGLYVFKREIFKKNPFYSSLKVREDWIFKGKILALNPPFIVKEPLGIIREHPHRLRNMTDYYLESTLFSVEILFKELPKEFSVLKPYAKAKAYMEIGIKLAKVKRYKEAYENYIKAFREYPKLIKEFKFLKKFLKSFILKNFSISKN